MNPTGSHFPRAVSLPRAYCSSIESPFRTEPAAPELPLLQKMQPPKPFMPSMLGQVQPMSSDTFATLPPKRVFRYQS